tara:strand:- start:43223 stop:44368 length:1146 start_codon:yes stop_codon:yes gene_type:complete
MKLDELKITSANDLNESLAKTFGTKLRLNDFTNEQLEDARNKLRTQLSQVETNESFETVHTSDAYQKGKMMLDTINREIEERAKAKPDYIDIDGDGDKKEPMKKAAKDKEAKKEDVADEDLTKGQEKLPAGLKKAILKKQGKDDEAKDIKEAPADEKGKMPSKAHIMKMCKDGKTKEEICKMHPDCDQGKLKAMIDDCKKEMNEALEGYIKLIEGEEDKATLVMAAKDMVDRLTGWMEDTAEMQTESMLELGDKIRDELGSEKSEEFINTVKPALENLYTVFETTREALTGGVAIVTGEGAPEPMGADPEAPAEEPMEPTVDQEAPGAEEPVATDDEFGASEPATGGEEMADREKRESVERSRRLGQLLTDSKKKAPQEPK